MDNNDAKKTLQESVLDTIEQGKVAMRPRWYFLLRAALALVGGILVILALFYVASLIVFLLRETGVSAVPIFGFRGWFAFLVSLPWLLVLLAVFFVCILELLVRRYAFAYRRPLLYSVGGIFLLVVIGGSVVDRTHLHPRLFHEAQRGRMPFGGQMYRSFGERRFHNIHRGTIVEMTKIGLTLEDDRAEKFEVLVTPRTRLPLGADFSVGDTVVVFGEKDGRAIVADGIRKVSHEE